MLNLIIENLRNIEYLELKIPLKKGVYAITGENAIGKSTILNTLSKLVYQGALNAYFKNDGDEKSKITFKYKDLVNTWIKTPQQWQKEDEINGLITFSGAYEGSLIYGNRFSDANKDILKKLKKLENNISDLWVEADSFVIEKAGYILKNDKSYYSDLKRLRNYNIAKAAGFKNILYARINNHSNIIYQFKMSSGEFLIIGLLHYLNSRIEFYEKKSKKIETTLIFLDEIELALHPSAQKRLIDVLNEISNQNDFCIYFSTHSSQIINKIVPEKIYHIEKGIGSKKLNIINPCYPAYSSRQLYMEADGFDFIFLVEDELAKYIVEEINKDLEINKNRLIYILPSGGWTNTLSMHKDLTTSRAAGSNCKIISILDKDIENEYEKEYRNDTFFSEKSNKINIGFLPIDSLEKFLKRKLIDNPDNNFIKNIGDDFFRGCPR